MSSLELQIQNKQNNSASNDNNGNNSKFNCFLCQMIKWYFEPVYPKLGYSLCVMFYHVFNFGIALAAFIIVCVGLSVSLGLMILFFGFLIYYLFCEITLLIARFNLCFTYHLVEEKDSPLRNRPNSIEIDLVRQMPSCKLCWRRCFCDCPCLDSPPIPVDSPNASSTNNNNNNNHNSSNMSLCAILRKRLVTLLCSCQMLIIYLYFLIVKPVTTLLTSWTIFLVVYALYLLIIPPWYIIDDRLFKNGMLCPFGYTSCHTGNDCVCHGLPINNYGTVFLTLLIAVLAVPLAFRIDNYSGKLSKVVTYYCLTRYCKCGINSENTDQQQLLYENNV